MPNIKSVIQNQNANLLSKHTTPVAAHSCSCRQKSERPTLCSKDVCTITHILGACKISLQQGRYTCRHDTVLHKIIESLKSFILNIKQTVPISPKSFIKFVKKGTKVPRKRTPPVGILHQTSDWVVCGTFCS